MEVARVRVEAPSLQMFWGTLIECKVNTICTLKNPFSRAKAQCGTRTTELAQATDGLPRMLGGPVALRPADALSRFAEGRPPGVYKGAY